jgi:hypothetical protein
VPRLHEAFELGERVKTKKIVEEGASDRGREVGRFGTASVRGEFVFSAIHGVAESDESRFRLLALLFR